MNGELLITELSHALGIELKFSEAGTCGVFFDDDEVIFEQHDGQLYLIADLGSAAGRSDAYGRLLAANCLGQESGNATLGLDTVREEFTLHRILNGDMGYQEFEKILTVFVQALRYWKEWLVNPPASAEKETSLPPAGGIQA
ncbi:MAG: type III secretion system chaperone [Desulfovibrio sp.]|nr:type III secretion system chaperone [Desulfovibrio sp.]